MQSLFWDSINKVIWVLTFGPWLVPIMSVLWNDKSESKEKCVLLYCQKLIKDREVLKWNIIKNDMSNF